MTDKECPQPDRYCPIDKILPNGELKEFVKEMRKLKEEVIVLKDKMPSKKPIGTILTVAVTLVLIAIGWAYSAGTLSSRVDINTFAITRLVDVIDKEHNQIVQVSDKLDDTRIDLAKVNVQFGQIASDVKDIKEAIIIYSAVKQKE